jgi:hypothetical protein
LPDVALDTNIFASGAFLSILSCDHRLRLREVPFGTVTYFAALPKVQTQ